MKDLPAELKDWQFEIHEASCGVYTVDAKHGSGAKFYLKGTDNDGGESFLRAYATAVEKSGEMNTLHNLDNWSVSICKVSAVGYIVNAVHRLGPKASLKVMDADDAVFQLHVYASELERAVENKR